jgi:hypothetical protein
MQGTSLRADDSRIDALAPTHAVAVRALLAEPSFETRNERAASLLAELGLTPVPPQRYSLRAIGEPKPWSEPEGRLLALLAEVEIDLAHYPMYSVPSWVRRWLGLEPAGALFARLDDGRTRLEALRAAQEDDHAFEALIASFPVADRLEILVDLLDGDQDFAGAVEDLLQRTIESLDGSAGPWPRAQAERTGTAGTLGREQALREQAIFLALVRAKIAIEPEWDALVPLVFGSYVGWIMEECVRAIPAERRAAAVVARLERCDPHVGRPRLVALAALELVPEPAIARWVYARRNEHPKPQEITDHLRALGKDHPAILAVLTEPVAPPRFSVALVPVEPLDSAAAQQLEVASTRYDGKKRRAAAILAGDDDDEAIVPSTIRRIALTENGGRAYDAWTYMGDTATVFVAGTTEVVAEVVQGGLECRDAELKGELRTALAEAGELERSSRKTPTKAKAPPKPAVKKTKEPSAKKTTETSPAKKAKRATTTTSKKAPKKKR